MLPAYYSSPRAAYSSHNGLIESPSWGLSASNTASNDQKSEWSGSDDNGLARNRVVQPPLNPFLVKLPRTRNAPKQRKAQGTDVSDAAWPLISRPPRYVDQRATHPPQSLSSVVLSLTSSQACCLGSPSLWRLILLHWPRGDPGVETSAEQRQKPQTGVTRVPARPRSPRSLTTTATCYLLAALCARPFLTRAPRLFPSSQLGASQCLDAQFLALTWPRAPWTPRIENVATSAPPLLSALGRFGPSWPSVAACEIRGALRLNVQCTRSWPTAEALILWTWVFAFRLV